MVARDVQFMRDVNSLAIVERLRVQTPLSISSLASAVGLSRQAVTRSLALLEQRGLVEVLDESRSSGPGRPAQLVRFRAEAGYVLGISVDPDETVLALADLAGNMVATRRAKLRGKALAGRILKEVDGLLRTPGVARRSIWSAVVGVPGVTDYRTGTVQFCPSMNGLVGDGLANGLRSGLPCPVFIDNDIKIATQGAVEGSAAEGSESLIFVHWGERLGAGIILRGELHRGFSNDAGDIGFLDLVGPDDAPDPSEGGRLGRFEAWVGAREVVRLALKAAGEAGDKAVETAIRRATGDALEIVIDQALAGNAAALRAVEEAARRFTAGAAAIRAILDPEFVVIGGAMSRLGDVLLGFLRAHFEPRQLNQTKFAISSQGDGAVLRGAIRCGLAEIAQTRLPQMIGQTGAARTRSA